VTPFACSSYFFTYFFYIIFNICIYFSTITKVKLDPLKVYKKSLINSLFSTSQEQATKGKCAKDQKKSTKNAKQKNVEKCTEQSEKCMVKRT